MEYEEHLRNTLEKVWRQSYTSCNDVDDDINDVDDDINDLDDDINDVDDDIDYVDDNINDVDDDINDVDDDNNDRDDVKDGDVFCFQGMDAESYSLHTFEALLTQSMENLGRLPP